jgi:NADPH2:quinone reductase
MRALVMTRPSQGPDRTEVREVEAPRPGAGEVTIDVTHAGINFIDVMARRGDAGYVASWPFTPGKEVAGTIRELGEDVTDLAVGQRVAAFLPGAGGLAEVALAPAALTVPVPDEVPSATAAAAPLMLTTALMLLTDAARFGAGDTVLVHSASGGVGSAVAQLVPALGGGRLIGVVGRAEKIPAALKSGYDAAVVRDDYLAEAVRAAAGGAVDVVLDPLGTAMVDTDLAVTAPGGRIVLFGNAGGGQSGALPPLDRLRAGNIAVAGFSVSALAVTAPHRVAVALRRVLDLVADGRLDLPVTEVGSPAEVPATHQLLAEGKGSGKYVVRIAQS